MKSRTLNNIAWAFAAGLLSAAPFAVAVSTPRIYRPQIRSLSRTPLNPEWRSLQLGELGQKKSQNMEVKNFAAQIVKDHTAANKKLMAVAGEVDVELPTTPSSAEEAAIKKLQTQDAAEFDKAYMKQMIENHEKDVALFERASKEATNPKVKAFATETLPTLKEHLGHAEKTSKMADQTASR